MREVEGGRSVRTAKRRGGESGGGEGRVCLARGREARERKWRVKVFGAKNEGETHRRKRRARGGRGWKRATARVGCVLRRRGECTVGKAGEERCDEARWKGARCERRCEKWVERGVGSAESGGTEARVG